MASDDFQERLRRIGEKSIDHSAAEAPKPELEPEVMLETPAPAKTGKKAPVHVGARISPTVAILGFGAVAAVGMVAALTFGKLTPDSVALNQDVVKEEKAAPPPKITELFSAPAAEEPATERSVLLETDQPETAN